MSMECSSASTHPPIDPSCLTPMDGLQYAREKLRQAIVSILEREVENPAASPDWLAFQLEVVYQEASALFEPLWRDKPSVGVTGSQVSIHQGASTVGLKRCTTQGWTDTQYGLYGAHLAQWLSAWPCFALPATELSFSCSLNELRSTLARPDAHAVTYADEVLHQPLSPILRDYIHHRIARWPLSTQVQLAELRHRRFAHFGLQLLKSQSHLELEEMFDCAYDIHPGDACWLGSALEHWLARVAPIWSPIIERSIRLSVHCLQPGHVTLGDGGGNVLELEWRDGADSNWSLYQAPEGDLVRTLMEQLTGLEHSIHDELDDINGTWELDESASWFTVAALR